MTTAKKTAKTTTKKATTKKTEKTDFSTFTVSGTELAGVLGLTLPNITQMKLNGNLVPDADGKFNLREAVSSYCKRLREKKSGDSKSELELENIALKNEKIKEGLRSWRMARDRDVAMAILESQRNALLKLRDECKLVPALVSAIDDFISAVDATDVEQITYTVEGEGAEDEE